MIIIGVLLGQPNFSMKATQIETNVDRILELGAKFRKRRSMVNKNVTYL